MKSTITLGLMMAALFLSTSTTAQVKEARFGHINVQEVFDSMPGAEAIAQEISTLADMYQAEFERMG